MYKYTWSFLPKYTWSFLPSAGSPRPQAQLIYMMQLYLHVRNVKQLAYMYMCTCTSGEGDIKQDRKWSYSYG